MSVRWHIVEEAGEMTLCRQLPPRFDVAASAHLPPARPARLAHQIRQDLWRALANVRGFSPVVRLAPSDTGWRVTAGGRVMGRISPSVESTNDALLNDASKRARWVKSARLNA
ncbi:hypothetical protein [uncultured Tateyamaria sp.]|uniref:hypothetical protein n=1 Tax=uncultured Tateyamaria sp. TaxID=455651 RepID=UPI00262C75AB|nr:hypothetical protein [uncultured Tateyamaria sp.]